MARRTFLLFLGGVYPGIEIRRRGIRHQIFEDQFRSPTNFAASPQYYVDLNRLCRIDKITEFQNDPNYLDISTELCYNWTIRSEIYTKQARGRHVATP